MKPSDYRIIDLKHAFEPIAMLTVSKWMREMGQDQIVEFRIYDMDLLENINRLFSIFEKRLSKEESYSKGKKYWRMVVRSKEGEIPKKS